MVRVLLTLVLVGGLAGAVPARAEDDQDRARTALERGEVRPLGEVLAAARAAVPGDVVDVRLRRKKDRWRYELKVLTPAGKRREVEVDARTLAILDTDDDD